MQPVTSVIDPQSAELEAPGVPANHVLLLQHSNIGFVLNSKLPCGSEARGTGSQDRYSRFSHFRKRTG